MTRMNRRCTLWVGLALAGPLGACASTSPLPPPAPVAAPAGQMVVGRIVAIRPVAVSAGQGDAGLDAVLTALGQQDAILPQSGQEFVIRQDDGTTVAIAQPSAEGFAVGDEVGIVEADETTIIHR